MKWRMICVAALGCMSGWQSALADEPGARRPTSGATTKPFLEPGDVGQTTVAPSTEDGPLPIAIRWWGQACVSIETFWGFAIVVDPFSPTEEIGFPKPDLTADLVLVTHEHFDHNAVDTVKGKPVVLRGLTDGGKEWARIDHYLDRPPNQPAAAVFPREEARNLSPYAVHVLGVGVFHDDQGGTRRGKNTMFLIETNGVRILHCGDLGHVLTPEQVTAIGPVDVLILPVGGTYTIDAAQAMQVVQQLKPRRFVWPIHFRAAHSTLPLAGVEPFVTQARRAGLLVRRVKGNAIAVASLSNGQKPPIGSPAVIVSGWIPERPKPDVERSLLALRGDRQALIASLGKVSKKQLDWKPSDGTHTIRWNFEHTTARELGFFSQVYHALDPSIPVINWNPAQMPPDYVPRRPDWDTAEMVRHVQRVGAFTERFSYLLADTPATMRIEGTRFSIDYLTALVMGHYKNHTTKAVHKLTLPDWPKA